MVDAEIGRRRAASVAIAQIAMVSESMILRNGITPDDRSPSPAAARSDRGAGDQSVPMLPPYFARKAFLAIDVGMPPKACRGRC